MNGHDKARRADSRGRVARIARGAATAGLGVWPRALRHVIAMLMVDRVNVPRFARPSRRYRAVTFRSGGVELSGWLFEPDGPPRGLVVHLHGRMYSKIGGIATAEALVPRGYAVLAYDQRAHGASGGAHCTYGWLEKADLARAIDAFGIAPVVVVGHSYGAAVALLAAADDERIRAIVAVSSYAELHTAFAERVEVIPFVSRETVASAQRLAEARAAFRVDEVSPLQAAARLDVPVLLVHGARDRATPPAHSERLFAALRGPKRLHLVEGAMHTDVLDGPRAAVWAEIARFLDEQVPRSSQ